MPRCVVFLSYLNPIGFCGNQRLRHIYARSRQYFQSVVIESLERLLTESNGLEGRHIINLHL